MYGGFMTECQQVVLVEIARETRARPNTANPIFPGTTYHHQLCRPLADAYPTRDEPRATQLPAHHRSAGARSDSREMAGELTGPGRD